MSCYGWESGTFTLPTKDVTKVKTFLREYTNALHDEVKVAAVALHKEVGTTSKARYSVRLRSIEEASWETNAADRRRYTSSQLERRSVVNTLARRVLEHMIRNLGPRNPHQPTTADVEEIVPRATTKITDYCLYDKNGSVAAFVTLNGKVLTYRVEENNHAVDDANETPIVQALFSLLGSITWTRGTGGYTSGNNEYNRDDRTGGGGANYLCRVYGPLGKDALVSKYMRNGFTAAKARKYAENEMNPKPTYSARNAYSYGRW